MHRCLLVLELVHMICTQLQLMTLEREIEMNMPGCYGVCLLLRASRRTRPTLSKAQFGTTFVQLVPLPILFLPCATRYPNVHAVNTRQVSKITRYICQWRRTEDGSVCGDSFPGRPAGKIWLSLTQNQKHEVRARSHVLLVLRESKACESIRAVRPVCEVRLHQKGSGRLVQVQGPTSSRDRSPLITCGTTWRCAPYNAWIQLSP
jgi:hypothetical protein